MGVGANGNEIVTALTVSDNDTIYIAGETDGDLKETNAGNKDAFIAKFDKNGIHQWTQQLGNTSIGAAASGNDLVAGISINSSGNLFITGTTDGNLGEANGGGNDAYIAKFDANGTHIWTSQLGGITVGAAAAGNDLANAIAITNTGEVIIAGSTNGDLGETNSGLSDIYVSKFSTTGTHLWTQQLGTSSIAAAAVGDDQVSAISLDSNGNIFVTGRTSGSLGEAVGGSYDSYIAKFNSNGAYQWVRQLGNITIGSGASMTDSGNAIALDSSGHIIIAGNTLGALSQLNGGSSDIYAAKLASDNSSILWTSQIGAATLGSGSAGNDIALASVVDANGALLVAGYTYGSVGEANGGSSDILITKFDANGHYVWAKQLGKVTMGSASSGADAATAIALDSMVIFY
ncbi:MAG: SBBP repeat-containing protein [Bdellovibrionota bacterium]